MNWMHTRTDRHMAADDTFIMHISTTSLVSYGATLRPWRGEVMSAETGHVLMHIEHMDARYVRERCEEFAHSHRAEYERTS